MEVPVESLTAPHERPASASAARGLDAAFELRLAEGARGAEAAVGGGSARREEGDALTLRRVKDGARGNGRGELERRRLAA